MSGIYKRPQPDHNGAFSNTYNGAMLNADDGHLQKQLVELPYYQVDDVVEKNVSYIYNDTCRIDGYCLL